MIPRQALIQLLIYLTLISSIGRCDAFTASHFPSTPSKPCSSFAVSRTSQQEAVLSHQADEEALQKTPKHQIHRRELFTTAAVAAGIATVTNLVTTTEQACAADQLEQPGSSSSSSSSNGFVRAVRPTAYRVDSTIPPTLLPVPTARGQMTVLRDLGKGLGTDKEAVFIDRLNLNNMLQKAVYGTANAISNLGKGNDNVQAPASFVCLGLPMRPRLEDMELTVSLMQSIMSGQKQTSPLSGKPNSNMAIGVAMFPIKAQASLDDLVAGRITLAEMQDALAVQQQQVSTDLLSVYQSLLEFAVSNRIPLVAMGLTEADRTAVQTRGLQTVDPVARAQYVVDTEGFIATTNDATFKLYTDRSLLKDLTDDGMTSANFFAERILAHEAGATAVSKYALAHPGTVVAVVAPVNDVRYLGGINGRIPRVYQYLSAMANTSTSSNNTSASSSSSPAAVAAGRALLTAKDVTTILLNPTAPDSLSRTVRLRLEIGTGPDTLAYQTKIADYLWFSSSPAVSLLPRVMDY